MSSSSARLLAVAATFSIVISAKDTLEQRRVPPGGAPGRRTRRVARWSRCSSGSSSRIFRSRAALVAENELLRQQLAAAKGRLQGKRVRFSPWQRWTTATLARFTPTWRSTVTLFQPTTVLRWHREGFRLFWRWRSRRAGRKPTSHVSMIRDMVSSNPRWGAERIRGELLKIGIRVSKRTIQR